MECLKLYLGSNHPLCNRGKRLGTRLNSQRAACLADRKSDILVAVGTHRTSRRYLEGYPSRECRSSSSSCQNNVIFTDSKRSFGRGNMFAPVCHSVVAFLGQQTLVELHAMENVVSNETNEGCTYVH